MASAILLASLAIQLIGAGLALRVPASGRIRGWAAAAWVFLAGRSAAILAMPGTVPANLFAESFLLVAAIAGCSGQAFAIPYLRTIVQAGVRHRESEDRLRTIVEGTKDYAFIALDAEGCVADWNTGARRMFGYEPGEILGRSVSVLMAPEERSAGRSRERVRAASSAGRLAEQGWLTRRDGSRFRGDVVTTVLRDDAGPPRGFALFVHDLTERIGLEQQLLQAQKMEAVGRLAGGIAHDFNNLLTVITGYAQMLALRHPPGHPDRHRMEEILRAADRATGLTRQLLAFGRKQAVQPKVLDLNAVVVDVERMLRRLIGEDIELVTDLHPETGRILADAGQVEQAIMNLVVNARDALPRGGRIRVGTSNTDLDEAFVARHPFVKPGPYVRLEVEDNGHGMDAATLSHVFEPFFTTKEPGRGTGLGLATVYGIVKQHNGYVLVESAPGRGSVFRIYFPRVWGRAETRAVVPTSAEPASAPSAETILLVEDDASVRAFARDVLREAGYQVLEAEGGEEAIRIVGNHTGPIHLLLTDSVMPRMGGGDLARSLSAQRPGLRVLYMSGHTESDTVRRGDLDRKAPILYKPFTPSDLLRWVRQALSSAA